MYASKHFICRNNQFHYSLSKNKLKLREKILIRPGIIWDIQIVIKETRKKSESKGKSHNESIRHVARSAIGESFHPNESKYTQLNLNLSK